MRTYRRLRVTNSTDQRNHAESRLNQNADLALATTRATFSDIADYENGFVRGRVFRFAYLTHTLRQVRLCV